MQKPYFYCYIIQQFFFNNFKLTYIPTGSNRIFTFVRLVLGRIFYNRMLKMTFNQFILFQVVSELNSVFNGRKPLKYLRNWGTSSLGMLPSKSALVFVDNHDTQRNSDGLNYKTATNYKVIWIHICKVLHFCHDQFVYPFSGIFNLP